MDKEQLDDPNSTLTGKIVTTLTVGMVLVMLLISVIVYFATPEFPRMDFIPVFVGLFFGLILLYLLDQVWNIRFGWHDRVVLPWRTWVDSLSADEANLYHIMHTAIAVLVACAGMYLISEWMVTLGICTLIIAYLIYRAGQNLKFRVKYRSQ